MLKRICAVTLALLIAVTGFASAEMETVEEEPAVSMEVDLETRELDEVTEDEDTTWVPLGPVYEEPSREDYSNASPALYTARMLASRSVFTEHDIESERLLRSGASGCSVEVLYVGSAWCIVRGTYKGKKVIGYAKRDYLTKVNPVDEVNTPPYGVQKATYIATTATTCHVRKSMSDDDESWKVLNPGTLVSLWVLRDGWAIVPYWRTYGYINLNELTDLIQVSPTDDPLGPDTPIAAYTSYYNTTQTKYIIGRIINIDVACRRLTRVMKSKQTLDFNEDVGPFKASLGYQEAPVLINGTTKPGYGGGTCQVSSTLYNALLQLPGITIIERRPHGPSGAQYLPHGVDAAVGSDSLNLVFRNNYSFSIRIEGHTTGDGALTMVIYRVDQ